MFWMAGFSPAVGEARDSSFLDEKGYASLVAGEVDISTPADN
jgi:hypothetical protein